MKGFICVLLTFILLLGLCPLGALADGGPQVATLYDPGSGSETREQGGSWAPASLDDEPYQESYDEPEPETDSDEEAASEEGIMMAFALFDLESELDGLAPDLYVPDYSDGSGYDPRINGVTVPIRDQGTLPTCWSVSALSCAELGGLKKGLLSGTPNLSEWHLEYFSRKGFTDPLGNTGGDYISGAVFSGGNPYMSVMTLATWMGPADETKTGTAYESISRSQSLDSSLALSAEMHLENAYWLAMERQGDWEILQEQIQTHGAAILCFNMDASNYSSEYCSYYSSDGSLGTNHEVTVVGWDDNFPKEYFRETAPGDGAWLCRNSNGTGFGDEGYFWLSYYDAVLRDSVAAVFDFASVDNYDNNYQYDGCAVQAYIPGEGSQSYANVFTAKANAGGYEELRAISTYSYFPGISYGYEIYTGLSDPQKPDSGTLVASGSGRFTYAGYYTIDLNEAVRLYEGQSFSVIFTVSATSDGKSYVPTCSSQESWDSVNISSAGESFLWWNNGWYDLSEPGSGNEGSNVRIKAFTENKSGTVTLSLDAQGGSGSPESLSVVWGQAPGDALTAPSRSGFDFQGWMTDEGSVFDASERLFENTSLEAAWLRSWNDPFSDVTSSRWYYGNVRYCYQNQLLLGITDSYFGGSSNATRAQIVTILYRMAGEPVATESLSFDDVSASDYYADAVRWAAAEGIVLGSDDDGDGVYSYRPTQYVTRQDFVLMLYRYAKWLGEDTSAYESTDISRFTDNSRITSYALTAEKWSVGSGLQVGNNNQLLPLDTIVRSEVAAMLSRFDGYEAE